MSALYLKMSANIKEVSVFDTLCTTTFLIPPDLAYGSAIQSKIPPNSPLRFDVKFLWLKGDTGTIELKNEPDEVILKILGLIPKTQ